MKLKLFFTVTLVFASVLSFAGRPLGADDFAALDNGKSGFELGYDNNQNLAFAVKHAPIQNLELSAEYSLPNGTAFAIDQVVINAKLTLTEKGIYGLAYGCKAKYDYTAKKLGLTGIGTFQSDTYNLHANISYNPDAPVTFSLAGDLKVIEIVEPVGEISLTGTDINGLIGLRYEVAEGNTFDVATAFPVSGSGSSSSFIGFSSEF